MIVEEFRVFGKISKGFCKRDSQNRQCFYEASFHEKIEIPTTNSAVF